MSQRLYLVKRAVTGGKLLQPDMEISSWGTAQLQKLTDPGSDPGSASPTLPLRKGADSRGCRWGSPRWLQCLVGSASSVGLWRTQRSSLALLGSRQRCPASCAGLESPRAVHHWLPVPARSTLPVLSWNSVGSTALQRECHQLCSVCSLAVKLLRPGDTACVHLLLPTPLHADVSGVSGYIQPGQSQSGVQHHSPMFQVPQFHVHHLSACRKGMCLGKSRRGRIYNLQ